MSADVSSAFNESSKNHKYFVESDNSFSKFETNKIISAHKNYTACKCIRVCNSEIAKVTLVKNLTKIS